MDELAKSHEDVLRTLLRFGGSVYDEDGAAASVLFKEIDSPKSTISTAITRLEEMGLIDRERHEHPKRTKRITINEDGMDALGLTGDEGQDRESYTDDQDRDSYVPEGEVVELSGEGKVVWEPVDIDVRTPESLDERTRDAVEIILDIAREEAKKAEDEWVAEVERLEWNLVQANGRIEAAHERIEELEERVQELLQENAELKHRVSTEKGQVKALRSQVRDLKAEPKKPAKPRTDIQELIRKDRRHGDWKLSPHAENRMFEMNLDYVDVYKVVADPEVDYEQSDYEEGQRLAQRGELAVVYNNSDGRIITVLWRKEAQWTREDFKKQLRSKKEES